MNIKDIFVFIFIIVYFLKTKQFIRNLVIDLFSVILFVLYLYHNFQTMFQFTEN